MEWTIGSVLAGILADKSNATQRHSLREYHKQGLDRIRVFMKKEPSPANDIRSVSQFARWERAAEA
jgi:hypothetical protein